jgi:hypothetical protein
MRTLRRAAVICLGACITMLAAAGAQSRGYAPGMLIVAYREGITVAASPFVVEHSRLLDLRARDARGQLAERDVPRYTSDVRTNRAMLEAGVARSERLFGKVPQMRPTHRLHVIGESVQQALARIRALPTVLYASPDWYVSPMIR